MKFSTVNMTPTSPESVRALQSVDPHGSRIIEKNLQARTAQSQASEPAQSSADGEPANRQLDKRLQKALDRFIQRDCLQDVVWSLVRTAEKHEAARPAAWSLLSEAVDVHGSYAHDDPQRWTHLRHLGDRATQLRDAYKHFGNVNTHVTQNEADPFAAIAATHVTHTEGILAGGALAGAYLSLGLGSAACGWGRRRWLLTVGIGPAFSALGVFAGLRRHDEGPLPFIQATSVGAFVVGSVHNNADHLNDESVGPAVGFGMQFGHLLRAQIPLPRRRDQRALYHALGITYGVENLSPQTQELIGRAAIDAAIARCTATLSPEET